MEYNSLIPELSVKNIQETKHFYLSLLGFTMEYERIEDKFIFLSYRKSQLMFEDIHSDGWNTGDLEYPLGRGVNFSIETKNIEQLYARVRSNQIKLFRPLKETSYMCNGEKIMQKEFLIQDPDGYLLRFIN